MHFKMLPYPWISASLATVSSWLVALHSVVVVVEIVVTVVDVAVLLVVLAQRTMLLMALSSCVAQRRGSSGRWLTTRKPRLLPQATAAVGRSDLKQPKQRELADTFLPRLIRLGTADTWLFTAGPMG